MRQALPLIIIATLLIGTVVDVAATGVKNVTASSHSYRAAPNGITVAVPATMKSFPTELLPQ